MKPAQLYSFDPPQIARSPSDIAKSPKGDDLCVKEMPKYFHWFAIEAHNTTVNIMDTVIEVIATIILKKFRSQLWMIYSSH